MPARYTYALTLTPSERAIAEYVADGLTNRETANALFISPHTVDYHLRQSCPKLNLRSRVELAQLITRRHAGQHQRPAAPASRD